MRVAAAPDAGQSVDADALRDAAGEALAGRHDADAAQGALDCLRTLPGPDAAADCALILAHARFQQGDLAGAAAALEGTRGKLGMLEAHGEKLLGEALLLSGHAREAIEPLRSAADTGGTTGPGLAAAALLADALFDTGAMHEAAAQAERASALDGQAQGVRAALAWTRAKALASLAEAARAAKSAQGKSVASQAANAARSFWRDFPDHPAASEATKLEKQLARLPGGSLPAVTPRDHLTRANRLLTAGQPALAVTEAAAACAKLSGDAKADANLLLARALAADGRRGDAGGALALAVHSTHRRTAAPALLLLARDHARRADSTGAVALLDQLVHRFPVEPEADEGAYLAARLLLDAGQTEAGHARLLHVAENHTASGAEARWSLAWLAYRAGSADAAQRFAAFASLASDDENRARGLYWEAKAGPPAASAELFNRALERDPLGWYGLLASEALSTAPSKALRFPPAGTSALALAGERLADPARRLLRIGFNAEATEELDRAAHQHRHDLLQLLPLLYGYQRAGRFDRSVPLAQTLLAGRPISLAALSAKAAAGPGAEDSLRALLDAAYPAAFADEVARSGSATGIDPYLLLSIARRESVFKPDAHSAAGAVGLLQLLPITARKASDVRGLAAPSDAELLEPAVAIDVGSWYLAQLLARFGDPAVAVASYNAGPVVVAPWARLGAGKPLDAWVEEIPFKETRHYVKIVIGAWSAYRILAGGDRPSLAATVPEVKQGTDF